MRATRQMSVTLPYTMADAVKARVLSGEYASESEVIRDGLRALAERERAIEDWLRGPLAATFIIDDGMTRNLSIRQARRSLYRQER